MKLNPISNEDDVGFQMSPMIDCVFQLLIFFMVCGVFKTSEAAPDVILPEAKYSQKKDAKPSELTINIKANGSIVVGSRTYKAEELADLIKDYSNQNNQGDVIVYVRGDKSVQWKTIRKVLSNCASAGIGDISFATYK